MNIEERHGLVIIGGGPACVKFLYQQLRVGRLPELLNHGLVIFEKQKTFGSGSYESKMTYANCSAKDILQLMHYPNGELMGVCSDIKDTHAFHQLESYGDKQPPKSLVGYVLRLMGNMVLRHIYALKKLFIFRPDREVISVRMQSDGWYQIRTLTQDVPIKDKYKSIRCKAVLLCIGRRQNALDILCTEKGLLDSLPKLSLVGSGQRAFEAAELLLNGPVFYIHQDTVSMQKIYQCPACKSIKCSCFGSLLPYKFQWPYLPTVLPAFDEEPLQLHFNLKPVPYFENSENDYLTITKDQINKQQEANYLSGLKGKARTLFLKILAQQDDRIKLNHTQQVIHSFGNEIDLKDQEGVSVPILKFLNLYKLDDKHRLRSEKGSIRNLFAFGSCCISFDQQSRANQREQIEPLECTLGFEDCHIIQINIKDIQLPWFDNNEFPATAQSQLIGNDFDSEQSVDSEIVETQAFALNQLQKQFARPQKQQKKKQ